MADRPAAHVLLRALRAARGLTQQEWARRLGYSAASLRRWESGAAVPSAQAEAILLERCQADGLFRAYAHGRLQHLEALPRLLSEVLAEARHHAASGRSTATVSDSEPAPHNVPAHLPQLIGLPLHFAAIVADASLNPTEVSNLLTVKFK